MLQLKWGSQNTDFGIFRGVFACLINSFIFIFGKRTHYTDQTDFELIILLFQSFSITCFPIWSVPRCG